MAAKSEIPAATYAQSADAVLMVRPASFGWNPQTGVSNHFQPSQPPASAVDPGTHAIAEFDGLAAALAQAGVEVHALADVREPARPDAVFPNNWVSLHVDGTVVLYPMLAPNRRGERRLELLQELERRGTFVVTRLLDLTHHELQGRFLEGTGSVVFDHAARVAFACLSPRTDAGVLGELCDELGYQSVVFDAAGPDGTPIYHTNVVLAIGSRCAVICADAVAETERGALVERLAASGRCVETIGVAQMMNFAGNVLELQSRAGESVLAMSQRAFASLAPASRERLAACVDRIVTAPVTTIEDLGGGSVRCMLAEVFLPRSRAASQCPEER